jgi:hypothetical protein
MTEPSIDEFRALVDALGAPAQQHLSGNMLTLFKAQARLWGEFQQLRQDMTGFLASVVEKSELQDGLYVVKMTPELFGVLQARLTELEIDDE